MTQRIIRIGTRESQLAVWQATHVQQLFTQYGINSELVMIRSDGDIDLVTPLYAMGVQGVFTKALDAALLNNRIDIAVHSMKDVPTQLASGIVQAAILERASTQDILVPGKGTAFLDDRAGEALIATSSIRRKAQWLHRFPHHTITNLRGNVNTRLRKLADENWDGAIFAAAGLERIGLRPGNAVELDWMLPAAAQGAIMLVSREEDDMVRTASESLNHPPTALCTRIERDFLTVLMGGCTAPISALATIEKDTLHFRGNLLSTDGKEKFSVDIREKISSETSFLGHKAGAQVLRDGAGAILGKIQSPE